MFDMPKAHIPVQTSPCSRNQADFRLFNGLLDVHQLNLKPPNPVRVAPLHVNLILDSSPLLQDDWVGLCDVESVVFRVEEGRILDDLEKGFVVVVF